MLLLIPRATSKHYYLIWFFENYIILLNNIIMMKLCMKILIKINYENKYFVDKFGWILSAYLVIYASECDWVKLVNFIKWS